MTAGPFLLYDAALLALAAGTLPPLADADLTAALLTPAHVPDLSQHATFGDISADELAGGDYRRLRVTGGDVVPLAGEAAAFTSDPLSWGDPVTLAPARYMALVFGLPGGLKSTSRLLGIQELASGAVEAVRGAFTLNPPVGGWFHLGRG